MTWLGSFYRSAVGKKAVMAVTGIVFWGFVLVHMIGNLKMFVGAEDLNHYAEWLREVGAPIAPAGVVLWIFRIVLLVALAFHVHAAIALTRMNREARRHGYDRRGVVQAGLSSRTMRWSGFALLAFVVWHVFQYYRIFGVDWGYAHGFVPHDVYGNTLSIFGLWWVTALYTIAMVLLGMHLYHGLWSMFQSLGWNHPRYNAWRRAFAVGFAFLISIGFLLVPLAVVAGWVS